MAFPPELIKAYNAQRRCADKRSICHAPSYSMYFGRDGRVASCCYTKEQPLGRYPDQSIRDLWSGQIRSELRRQLRQNELPKGCEICADQLSSGNFKGFLASTFDQFALSPIRKSALELKSLIRTGQPQLFPTRMEFELSNTCNLECEMCNGSFSSLIRKNRERLPPLHQVYDRRFVEELKPFLPHLTEARFFGGEPFLVDLYYDIWTLLIEVNPSCNVAITTNGTVFTPKVKRVLEKLNCQIAVSLDSVHKPTYESIRKNAVFESTMKNLEAFTAINRSRRKGTGISVCPMVSNWRELPDLISFANSRGLSVWFNTVIYPEELSLKYLPVDVQKEIGDFLRASRTEASSPTEASNRRVIEDLCLQIDSWIAEQSSTQAAKQRSFVTT